jgi:hypothetical protein
MKFLFIYLFSLVIAFNFATHSVHALTISPVKIEVAGDPGQTLRGEIELLNEQPQTKTFFSSFENFEPSGDSGTPRFVGNNDGLATWVATSPNLVVKSNEKIKIPFTISIPNDAEPGGYFAAIFWGEQDPKAQTGGEVAIGGKLGVLLLVRVNGDIVEEAGISDFVIVTGSNVVTRLPIQFAYKFTNGGGDRVVPLGDIGIRNIFGRTVMILPANENEGSVLPGSTRKFVVTWGDGSRIGEDMTFFETVKAQFKSRYFGVYTAEIMVVSGIANTPEQNKFIFFILPWQLLLTMFGSLVIFVLSLKKYNAWIVSRSK